MRFKKIKEKLKLYSKMVSELKLDIDSLRNKYMNNFGLRCVFYSED